MKENENKKIDWKFKIRLIIIAMYFLVLCPIAYSDTFSIHAVQGNVFDSNHQYVSGSFPVRINTTRSNTSVFTKTNGVGPPVVASGYGASVNGFDNESIIVMSWNATHYGINDTVNLSGTGTTYANVVVENLRPSETNVTILEPLNDSIKTSGSTFLVRTNISILGADATSCSAAVSFSDGSILALTTGEIATHELGDVARGAYTNATWNVTAGSEGASNITVSASCTSDGLNFERLNTFTVYNITVQDTLAPVVYLEYPLNNSKISETNGVTVTFRYNVSEDSEIFNCSLYINDLLNQTNNTVTEGISQNFTVPGMTNGTYEWNVTCYDNSSNRNFGVSEIFYFNITKNGQPNVTILSISPSTVDLNIGSTTLIMCNATVSDENGINDITAVNATFYHQPSASSNSADDNNYHYTDTSCSAYESATDEANYTCQFNVQYYSNNGTWICNITAYDTQSISGFDNISNYINDVIAIDVSPGIVDYDVLEPGDTTPEDSNITITNIGNVDINITVEGWGKTDGDGAAMICTSGNISLSNERYSPFFEESYFDMVSLTDSGVQVPNFNLPQRTNDVTYGMDRNKTYWKLRLPLGISGTCNGTIRLEGVDG